MEGEAMMLIMPMCARRGEAQSMIRRYFEERFPKSEQIELYFNGPRCYVKIVKVLPATKDDGTPTSIYQEHRERYDLAPGAGNIVMEVPS